MPFNRERAYQLMRGLGVDALIASSAENVYYLSNYWSLGKTMGCGIQAYALLPMRGDPAIIAPLNEADLIVDGGTWIDDIRFHGESAIEISQLETVNDQTEVLLGIYADAKPETDGVSALLKALEDRELKGGMIALDASGLEPSIYERIRGKLPDAKIVDGAKLLQNIRLVKTSSEVERIKRATEITEKSMEDALEITRSEIAEVDLAGMFSYSVTYDGGQVTQNLFGFRERSAFPHPVPSTFQARRGDLIRMTLGCTWDHYHSNISRTTVIGQASARVKRRWEAIRNAQDAALDLVCAGTMVSSVYAAAEKELEAAGFERYSSSLGHGLGLKYNEKPWIKKDSADTLLEGMVVNIDVPYLELGWGGMQLEDTVLVTEGGYELLTKTERDLYLL